MNKAYFGEFGGQFVPEVLMQALLDLEAAYTHYKCDEGFVCELKTLLQEYVNRPSPLYFAKAMSENLGGAKIYLKREDLNHTGSHKINNALGQALLAKKMGKMNLEQIREILKDTFKELNFDNLIYVKFVGDGTYLEFNDKFIEIRPSGTDAKTKAYGAGIDKQVLELYATTMGNYSGFRTELHKKYIDDAFYNSTKDKAMEYYLAFVDKDANNEKFEIPEYNF